jgi:hypothetical protein
MLIPVRAKKKETCSLSRSTFSKPTKNTNSDTKNALSRKNNNSTGLRCKKRSLIMQERWEKCRGKTNSLKEISPIIQISRFLKIMRRQGNCLNFRVHVNSDLKHC